jgi:hypothetical protein
MAALIAAKDQAYRERNDCVLMMAKMASALGWTCGLGVDEGEPDPEWQYVVYIETPQGQLSWHLPAREIDDFLFLPAYVKAWDGHTSEEKYARMRAYLPPRRDSQCPA